MSEERSIAHGEMEAQLDRPASHHQAAGASTSAIQSGDNNPVRSHWSSTSSSASSSTSSVLTMAARGRPVVNTEAASAASASDDENHHGAVSVGSDDNLADTASILEDPANHDAIPPAVPTTLPGVAIPAATTLAVTTPAGIMPVDNSLVAPVGTVAPTAITATTANPAITVAEHFEHVENVENVENQDTIEPTPAQPAQPEWRGALYSSGFPPDYITYREWHPTPRSIYHPDAIADERAREAARTRGPRGAIAAPAPVEESRLAAIWSWIRRNLLCLPVD